MHDQKKAAKGCAPVVVCQVAECGHAVPLDKVYYRRYKICPFHSSLPAMVLGGRTMRWCQQCGRFQGLEEFEGDRRSCKRTLEQHNARRRRANQSSLGGPSYVAAGDATRKAACKTAGKGGKHATGPTSVRLANALGPAAGPSPFSTSDCPASTCDRFASGHGSDSSGDGVGRGPSDTRWQAAEMSRWNSSTSGTDSTFYHPHNLSSPPHSRNGAGWSPSSTLPQAGPMIMSACDEARAEEAIELVMDHFRGDLELQDMLAWMPTLDCPSQSLSDILIPEIADRTQIPLSGLLPVGMDELDVEMMDMGPAADGMNSMDLLLPPGQGPATEPAAAAPAAAAQQPFPVDVVASLQSMQREYTDRQQQQQQFGGGNVGVGAPASSVDYGHGPAGPFAAAAAFPPLHSEPSLNWLQQSLPPSAREGTVVGAEADHHTPEQLLRAGSQHFKSVSLQGSAVPPSPMRLQNCAAGEGLMAQEHMVRVSLKLFNITPDQLPEQLRQDVANLVSADPIWVDTFVRPGCTHLTVVAMLSSGELNVLQRTGPEGLAQQLLRRGGWGTGEGQGQAWASDMLVQLGSEVAVVKQGRVAAVVNMRAVAPLLLAARPVAVLATGAAMEEQGSSTAAAEAAVGRPNRLGDGVVTLWGRNISGSHDMVVCRQSGRVLDLEVIARGKAPPSAPSANGGIAPAPEWVLVRPLGVGVGLLHFEVQRGGMLSAPALVAALPSRLAVAEAQLAYRALAGTPHRPNFLRNLGLVLSHRRQPSAGVGTSRHAAVLALGLLAITRSHGWQELSMLLVDALASGHIGASCAPAAPRAVPHLRCAVRSPAAGPVASGGEAAQPPRGSETTRAAGAAPVTRSTQGSPIRLSQLSAESHGTPSRSSWDTGVRATSEGPIAAGSAELTAADQAGAAVHEQSQGAADCKLGRPLGHSRGPAAVGVESEGPSVSEVESCFLVAEPSGSSYAKLGRTTVALQALGTGTVRGSAAAGGGEGKAAAAASAPGTASQSDSDADAPSTSASVDLGPKPKPSGTEDAAVLATRLLAMQLEAAEAEEDSEGELSDASSESVDGVLPPPEKVGGFQVWVALQMSGGAQRRHGPTLADRLASFGTSIILASVMVAAGTVFALREEFGEA